MKVTRDFLDSLCRIAINAGDAVMEVYRDDFATELKADDSPLTTADLRSNDIICERLGTLSPGTFIWSEESSCPPIEGEYHQSFFLVDPLDGTKEFVKRSGEFTVNIALIHHEISIAGVVYVPAAEILYFGGVGHGSRKSEQGKLSELKASGDGYDGPLRIIGSRSHSSPEQEAWLNSLPFPYTFIAAGSSLKFCRIAEGTADVYPRLAPTSQWDTAAAQCILEAAGGRVVDIHGVPIKYGTHMPVLNPSFFAVGAAPAPYIAAQL